MPRKRRHVDPVRVHAITLVVFGVVAGAALMLWTFPRFFAAIFLIAASVFAYGRLYTFIEARLEAEEGRLAEELGFDIDDDEDLPPITPKPRKKKKAEGANGTVATPPAEPPAAASPTAPSGETAS